MLNFKANHRKVVVADPGGVPTAIVTSANPHDASSAHTNAGVRFTGQAALDLLYSEFAVAEFSGTPVPMALPLPAASAVDARVSVQVISERCILENLVAALAQAGPGDQVDLVMFYLADRRVVEALKAAGRRGAALRIVLDPNRDAFGWSKDGFPNRPVAEELHRRGISLRWYDTHGEQCHTKMLLVRYASGEAILTTGSANCTRRNLDNFNLETDVAVRGPTAAPVFQDARGYVDTIWNNAGGRHCTVGYERYRQASVIGYWRYRLMEATGVSTF
jgi:phosphatidylserine/phosphatidylglycerophosphate/cardiolipin synthase-like enzyme